MKEEKFTHTRKPLHGWRLRKAEGEASEPRRRAQQQGCRGQSGEIPAQRIGAGPIDRTHQPERLVCSPAGTSGGWELRLGFRSDRRERTGGGSVNTA